MRAAAPAFDGFVARDGIRTGWVAISPGVPWLGPPIPRWVEVGESWDSRPGEPEGRQMANPSFWRRGGYEEWFRFFFASMLPEDHSTKQREDAVGWACDVPIETMIAAESAPIDLKEDDVISMIDRLDLDMLVIHETEDGCQLIERGRALAASTGADLLEMEGTGHIPGAREPVAVNQAILRFMDRLGASA